MSSSSALVVAAYLLAKHDIRLKPVLEQRLAVAFPARARGGEDEADDPHFYTFLGCCENGSALTLINGTVLEGSSGVGTFGGSEDHA